MTKSNGIEACSGSVHIMCVRVLLGQIIWTYRQKSMIVLTVFSTTRNERDMLE